MRVGVVVVAVVVAAGGGCRRPAARLDGGATRPVEARLGAADRHRPYRAGRFELPLAAEAALERRGDFQTLGDAALLAGRLDAASVALARAPASPSVDSDRAAVALARGDVEGALDRLADVLQRAPALGAARWNRALALRDLGLWRGAAAAFDQVAALGEPGWAAEARAQAAALRERLAARERAWKEASAAGKALVATGAPPPAAVLRAFPTYVRHYLYHAVRAAPSAARARMLAPLAVTLDARDGGNVLQTLVARTAARELTRRAHLSATYGRLSANPQALDRAAADAYLASLRRAGEEELLLGALILLNRPGDELARLARASGDPWFRAIADGFTGDALVKRNRLLEAEALLAAALADCNAHRLDYRCVYLESALADVYRRMYRTDEAQGVGRRALEHAWAHAPSRELENLMVVGDAARSRKVFALMEAYLDEGVRARPDSCDSKRWARELLAQAHLRQLDAARARADLDGAPRCNQPITPVRADTLANLHRLGFGGPDTEALPADLAAARAKADPGGRASLDVFEARLVFPRDHAAGEHLLDRALATAATLRDDVEARQARAYAYLTRAVEAALAGDDARALAALAAEADVPPPARCALGVAVDNERAVAIARDVDGRFFSIVDRRRTSAALDPERLAPAGLRAHLDGCDQVAVFAPPPVHGLPGLLPPELAWSYRLHAPSAAPPSSLRPRRLVIANVAPPPSLALPRLSDWRLPDQGAATVLEGAAATPARVLVELGAATEVEVHAHGLIDVGLSDAPVLVLSPDGRGRFSLSARDLAGTRLRGRPVVILGGCRAAQTAAYLHEPWGLPLALVGAGARAVFASPAPIGDADAGAFFAAVLGRVRGGTPPAVALRDERVLALSRDSSSWVRQLLVFE